MIVNILFFSHVLDSSDKFKNLLLIGMLKTNMLNMFSLFWQVLSKVAGNCCELIANPALQSPAE